MDRDTAGISWKYTTSGNNYKQPDNHADTARSGRYRHGTVRQANTPLPSIPMRNEFYHTSDACSAHYPPKHSVKPVYDFNALITQEKMDWLVRISARYGDRYDGKKHGQFASSIKQYTSASKRPLHHSEQRQLIPLLHDFKATPGWTWQSLTTTLHSFTSAGVFTPYKYTDEWVKETQAALLSTLLDPVILKCNQKPEARDIDAQGIANLLWAVAKLVDNGLALEKTPRLKAAVAALLPHVKTKAEAKEEKDHFKPQEVANLLWAVTKLVDNGLELEKTPKIIEAVAALLRHVKTKAESKEEKDHFNPQHIANLLWAVAKLVDNGLALEKTPKLKEAVAALLPHVKTKAESKEDKDHFNTQGTSNLLWAVAKLVDNGLALEKTPKLKAAVAALLCHVTTKAKSKEEQDHFNTQGTANLLWALATLVDSGLALEKTPKLKEAVAVLLYHVKTKAESKEEKDHFISQHIANLLWAVAKLVDNGLALEKTPKLKDAVAALLRHVKTKAESKEEKDHFNPQHIANLLWAVAKLVDNGLALDKTPKLKEAVAALLPLVKTKAGSKEEKEHFNTQATVNLLWAVVTLVDNGLELEKTAKLKEALAALLYHVTAKAESKEEKDLFIPKHIANLLWAVAKLGEAIELNLVQSTFDSLVDRISENPQFSQQGIRMSLWGVMVFCARFYLDSGSNDKNPLEKLIGELFSRLENTFSGNTEDQYILAMAASWLGRACPVVPHYRTNISQTQSTFRDQLRSSLPSLSIEEEKSLNSLPPVDLRLPDYNMVIDVQGPFHYVNGDFKTRNGSTLLKIALLQKLGFEVIEIPVNKLDNHNSMKIVIDQIKTRLAIPPEAHGSVSPKSGEESADEAYVTADEGGQFSDDCYFTAEEHVEEQTDKPKKRNRKRKKPVKTHNGDNDRRKLQGFGTQKTKGST
ncbi:RAP domain-containing protein [Endozoicomonas acroporae]|uniref:RAP domain-containing protein n=1 Tax=Endozoicomonas acroporae TaxID=1701104 RepID=UPI0013D45827|nr:RAP domain-containing protein [Endozoicomonas acroporae]